MKKHRNSFSPLDMIQGCKSGSMNKSEITYSPPTKELWRSKREVNRGKSRQIPFRKQWRSLFKKIATDRIVEVRPKKNGDHSGGEILAYFGMHHFCGRMTIFFFNSRYRGGLGSGLYPTKPLSNFL